jgi:murein DD-endopeptidase MepM/ murein hydrolase activator NlpD
MRRAAAAAGLAFAVAATASASFGRTPAAPGRGSSGELPSAALDSIDARLRRLESHLGMPAGATGEVRTFRGRYAALRAREEAVARQAEELLRFVPSASPVPSGVITSAFSPGRYHPIKLRVIPHVGLDIAAPHGTDVHATADGAVLATAAHPTYGLTVDLRHGDSGFITRYAHLSRIAVRPGQAVRRGDVIGNVGSTGLSTGPHTHYEVFYQGWRRDPIDFLPPGRVAADALLGAD